MKPLDPDEEVARRDRAYDVPAFLPGLKARVGWHGHWGSYWFEMIRVSIPPELAGFRDISVGDMYFTGGTPIEPITNLFDLLWWTWEEIDWQAAVRALRWLRDDPSLEATSFARYESRPIPAEVEDHLCEVFQPGSGAKRRQAFGPSPWPPIHPARAGIAVDDSSQDPSPAGSSRVTEHSVPATLPGLKASVGWHGEWGSFWFHIVRVADEDGAGTAPTSAPDVYCLGGDAEHRITNVADLLDWTWPMIAWEQAPGPKVLWRLRDDPFAEASANADALDWGAQRVPANGHLREVFGETVV